MSNGFPHDLVLTPVQWPLTSEDEDRYLPRGYVGGAPSVVFPYRVPGPDHVFCPERSSGNLLQDAPKYDPTGGSIYFESSNEEHLRALVRLLMGYKAERKDFIAFGVSAKDPVDEHYLDQIKLLTHVAASSVFEVEYDEMPDEQSITIEDAVVGFVQAQCLKWNEPGKTFSSRLSGAAGGDGEYAKEALAFGLHVENSHWGVLRLWSRAWLVTK